MDASAAAPGEDRSTKPRSQRPKAKILIAVWGAAYIRRFELLGLSSVLAPRNLPALAQYCDVEFVFLTRAVEFEHFNSLELMAKIRRYAAVRFEAIDDLIVAGLYTVTLTLAFTRGMRIFGEKMTEMYFVYWNADFVIADGSLAHLRKCMEEGRKVVLAGSVRVISEEVEPLLLPKTARDGVLTAPPRDLTRYLFEHPHLMQVAKTVDQNLCWASYPNHLFWSAGEDAIVARFFQIFMFCLQPTRYRGSIDGYCDYSFVPAFCPGEPIYVVGDSDEVCLLEMQERWQEAEDVHFGPGRTAAWLHNLQEWCTPEHAEIARQPIVYHAGDRPADIQLVIDDSADYVEWCLSQIREPTSYPGHYYWVHGVAAWRLRRSAEPGGKAWPPELDRRLPVQALKHPSFTYHHSDHALPPLGPPAGRFDALRRRLFGEAPGVIRRLHPDASALRPLVEVAARVQSRLDTNPRYRLLVVAKLGSWIDRMFEIKHGRVYRTEPLIAGTWRFQPDPSVDEVLIYHRGAIDDDDLANSMKNAAEALRPGGRLTVLCHYPIYHQTEPTQIGRDRLSFAVTPLADKQIAMHFAGPGRVRYARALAHVAPQIRHGSPMQKARALLWFARELAVAFLQPRTASLHTAWVFTARRPDPVD